MGCVFFPVLSHVDLADDVAGVAPVPSPSIGETWMEPLKFLSMKHFAFRVGSNHCLTPFTPPNNFSPCGGSSGMIYRYV